MAINGRCNPSVAVPVPLPEATNSIAKLTEKVNNFFVQLIDYSFLSISALSFFLA